MSALKPLGKEVLQRIVDCAAGDIRSALNCASLVATQIQQNSKKKTDPKLYPPLLQASPGVGRWLIVGWRDWSVVRGDWIYFMLLVG